MIYVIDPDISFFEQANAIKIFLAGGITGCPDWQTEFIARVIDEEDRRIVDGTFPNEPIVLFNPRRENFPIDDPTAAEFQIKWEFEKLRESDIISFWYCSETLCPIVLYEQGFWNHSTKPIVVGAHSDYQRRKDVIVQTGLARPGVEVVSNITDLVGQLFEKIQLTRNLR